MLSMQRLIVSIQSKLKDYRAHDKSVNKISAKRIEFWIKQFNKKSRHAILEEFNNILKKRYYSRKKAKKALAKFLIEIREEFGFTSTRKFLQNSEFLSLQIKGKSQDDLLALINEVIQEDTGMSLDECGVSSKSYTIYIDDMLCTGNTLLNDIRPWLNKKFARKKTNLEAIKEGSTKLILFYIFLHKRGYEKKVKQLRHEFPGLIKNTHFFCDLQINNYSNASTGNDLIFPSKTLSKAVIEYRKAIEKEADDYILDNGYQDTIQRYFRSATKKQTDKFFVSPTTRNLLEREILLKGIQILRYPGTKKKNIRALGFSLPSERNFGFGALCFTWRNISNNTPLVFWYSAGSFTPLFRRKLTE
jgi:hypothetical protein